MPEPADEFTLHVYGYRSTFRNWPANQPAFRTRPVSTPWRTGSATGQRPYRRGDQFEKRRKLMEAWQAFAESKSMANVLKLKR